MSRRAVVTGLVAVSGFCSLIYQVVWERTLRYNFGGDSVSAAIVTGTFLLGLGLGAVIFGRWHRRPFAVYALVEAGIGLYGLASFYLLAPLSTALSHLFPTPVSAAEGLRPVVVVASVLFLLPPCILIGGTGPLMFNCFIRPASYGASAVGAIYGANTLGAALGVVAAPFVFLNRLSLPATLGIVGMANLILGAAIWIYGSGNPPDGAPAPLEGARHPDGTSPRRAVLALAFLSGFIFLAFEVSLVRALFVQNPSSPYNFPATLTPVLLSIAAGSAILTRFGAYDERRALRRVGSLLVAAVVAMLLSVVASAALSRAGHRAAVLPEPRDALAAVAHAAILGTPLPLLLGAVLPNVLRLAAPTGWTLPARSGSVYLVNSIGAFTGALLTQFLAFPAVGTRGVLVALYLLGLTAGGWCLWKAATLEPRPAPAILGLLPLLAFGPFLVPSSMWRVYVAGVAAGDAEVIEGVTGIAVIEWKGSGGDVFVNGQYMSRLPDHPRHVRLVTFALSLPRREHVLLLGLGGGAMVRDLVRDPGTRAVEVVDWSYELPPLLDSPRARRLLDGALGNPKVTLRRCDARVAVSLYESGRFDVVIDNLTNAHWVGATSVKSIEYFRQLRRILKPHGVLVYLGNWGGARRAILAGLTETFPRVLLHAGAESIEDVVLASNHPLEIDPDHVADMLTRRGAVRGIQSPGDLVGGLALVTRESLRKARPVRDDLLVYEYPRDPVREVRRFLRSLGRAAGSLAGVT